MHTRPTTPSLTVYVVSAQEHGDLCVVTASNTHQAAAIALSVLRESLPEDVLARLVDRGWPGADDFSSIDTGARGGVILDRDMHDRGAQ